MDATDPQAVQRCAVGKAPGREACDASLDGSCGTLDAREIWQHAIGA